MFIYRRLKFMPLWEVLRHDNMIMGVFGSEKRAAAYCKTKNDEEALIDTKVKQM